MPVLKLLSRLALAIALLMSLNSCCFGDLFDDDDIVDPGQHNEGTGGSV